jgi:hypothetical protein
MVPFIVSAPAQIVALNLFFYVYSMHMNCYVCGSAWCYACGQPRGHESYCRCDTSGAYFESLPGWGNFGIGHESRALGALYEFHRRKMAYTLRLVKEQLEQKVCGCVVVVVDSSKF